MEEEEDRYPTMLPLSRVGSIEIDNGPVSSGVESRGGQTVLNPALSAIVEAVPAPILAVDGQFRVVVANAEARQLLADEQDSFLGYSVRRFLSMEKLVVARSLLLARSGKQSYRDRLIVGEVEREVEVLVDMLEVDGQEFLCMTFQDRTNWNRERAEWHDAISDEAPPMAHLERAHRLEALGHLTGALAHDFNNLLAVILGSLEGAQRRLKREMDPGPDLERALTATQRSIQATSQILRYARNRDNQSEPLTPSGVLLELRGLMDRAVGEGVELIVEACETPAIRIGAAQLETSLLNLAINARDALPEEGGQILFQVESRTFDDDDAVLVGLVPGPYVVISVVDNGTGMPDEVRERVFEPFFTTKPEGVGTGLGLSTVRSMVRKLGGAVTLESELGVGTTIRLIFPAVV